MMRMSRPRASSQARRLATRVCKDRGNRRREARHGGMQRTGSEASSKRSRNSTTKCLKPCDQDWVQPVSASKGCSRLRGSRCGRHASTSWGRRRRGGGDMDRMYRTRRLPWGSGRRSRKSKFVGGVVVDKGRRDAVRKIWGSGPEPRVVREEVLSGDHGATFENGGGRADVVHGHDHGLVVLAKQLLVVRIQEPLVVRHAGVQRPHADTEAAGGESPAAGRHDDHSGALRNCDHRNRDPRTQPE